MKVKIALLVCFFYALIGLEKTFFTHPQICTKKELIDLQGKKSLDMCWQFGNCSYFQFITTSKEVYFQIHLEYFPENSSEPFSSVKNAFRKKDLGTVFSYKLNQKGEEEFHPEYISKTVNANELNYVVADRRVFQGLKAKEIDLQHLQTILETKKVLFYSGAGLSLKAEVPAMSELNQLLGLEMGENFLFSLEKAVKNPKIFAEKIRIFHEKCVYSKPTKAHFAIKNLSFLKNITLFTENIDCLHETSGIFPNRIEPEKIRENPSLAEVDCIICFGLSFDDRGFLGWYKSLNPEGKILALDFNQPSYLGEEDFWLKGDIQEILPEIEKTILKKLSS